MTGEELVDALIEFYGPEWRHEAPKALGVNLSTLYRQIRGENRVLGPIVAWVDVMRELRGLKERRRRILRESYARRRGEKTDAE